MVQYIKNIKRERERENFILLLKIILTNKIKQNE
jgi:hypothetical protein